MTRRGTVSWTPSDKLAGTTTITGASVSGCDGGRRGGLAAVPVRRQRDGRRSCDARRRRQRTRGDPAHGAPAGGRDGHRLKRLLELGRAQELRQTRRGCGEIAAVGAPAQVPVEQRRLEQGQNPVQPERDRFTRTVATCGSHTG